MLKGLLIVVAVLVVCVAAVLAYAATRPDTFTLQRSATIKAPPERIFALINDFHSWPQWSPWEKLDPELKRSYGGAESGKGAIYEWEGNNKVGAGRMEILEAPAPRQVTIRLDFKRPFEANNTAEFMLQPQGDTTAVTWVMRGKNVFIGKVMSLFVDMDKMVGKDFETGLANLKAATEG
jgi:uncharacterized protein YndB with AHSA1/START domain